MQERKLEPKLERMEVLKRPCLLQPWPSRLQPSVGPSQPSAWQHWQSLPFEQLLVLSSAKLSLPTRVGSASTTLLGSSRWPLPAQA